MSERVKVKRRETDKDKQSSPVKVRPKVSAPENKTADKSPAGERRAAPKRRKPNDKKSVARRPEPKAQETVEKVKAVDFDSAFNDFISADEDQVRSDAGRVVEPDFSSDDELSVSKKADGRKQEKEPGEDKQAEAAPVKEVVNPFDVSEEDEEEIALRKARLKSSVQKTEEEESEEDDDLERDDDDTESGDEVEGASNVRSGREVKKTSGKSTATQKKKPRKRTRQISQSDIDILTFAAIAGCLTAKMAAAFSPMRGTDKKTLSKKVVERGVQIGTARNRLTRLSSGSRPPLKKIQPSNAPAIYTLTPQGETELLQYNALEEDQILVQKPNKTFYRHLFHNLAIAQTVVNEILNKEEMAADEAEGEVGQIPLVGFRRDEFDTYFIHEHEILSDAETHWFRDDQMSKMQRFQREMNKWDGIRDRSAADEALVENPRLWTGFDGYGTHRPDLVMYEPEGESVVFEIEDSPKKKKDYERIFSAFERELDRKEHDLKQQKYDKVVYVCTNRKTELAVTRAAERTAVGKRLQKAEFLFIERLTDADKELLELELFIPKTGI